MNEGSREEHDIAPIREDGPDRDGGEADQEIEERVDPAPDGGLRTHTVRLELSDEPGQLLTALEPIAGNGGNLISVLHERRKLTPRGRVPVEIDLECPPERLEPMLNDLREAGVTVISANETTYDEAVTFLLVGHLIDTDLSDTLGRIEEATAATVDDVSLTAPEGTERASSARIRMGARAGRGEAALATVRAVADEKGLDVIEPLSGGR